MSSLMTYLLNKFDIKIKIVVPYNHQIPSGQTQYQITFSHSDQATYQFGSDLAKIFITSNICIQHI